MKVNVLNTLIAHFFIILLQTKYICNLLFISSWMKSNALTMLNMTPTYTCIYLALFYIKRVSRKGRQCEKHITSGHDLQVYWPRLYYLTNNSETLARVFLMVSSTVAQTNSQSAFDLASWERLKSVCLFLYRVTLKHLLSICHELCISRHVWVKLMLKTHFYIPLHSCLRQSYYTVHFIYTHISGIDYF